MRPPSTAALVAGLALLATPVAAAAQGTGGTAAPTATPTAASVTPATPPTADDVTPLPPETPAATPAALPSATPAAVYRNADDPAPRALLLLAAVAALLALLALLYALAARWDSAAGVRRAGREAGFRAGGAWGDFTDWVRIGR